jgi:hypothetical protein
MPIVLKNLGSQKLLVTEYKYEKLCTSHWKFIAKVYQQNITWNRCGL